MTDTTPPSGQETSAPGLTELEQEVLIFERQWWKYAGAKETEVRDRFDVSMTRYYQVLNALIDRPEALEHDAMLVHRLRRVRDSRRDQRQRRRGDRVS